MSSKNSSPDSNKKDRTHDNNSNFNPLIEGLTLAQSSAMALITVSSEILEAAPKMIDYWFNTFLEPLTRTSTATTTEEQKREKVKVE
ncbi:hypothetical protein [Nitrososphaera sp. AFS]|uniref:hypothetical protein n=1 Tax=Nitrososphaera sp. AFS TaxID=2301191 RepID=UPI00139238FD|nr:hypothetical protein [Nitrososphaera sp. AFS]NAL77849.1 hypothetical protein [Nitrososphaera sp. AFS]